MNESMIRYYKILEVDSRASLEDIRTAYRQMSQAWHPHRFNDSPSLQSKAKKHIKEINLAYTKLLQHIAEKNRQAALRAFESGVGHFRAERYDKAVEYFMRAIEIIPDHFDAHFWMAQAYYRLRQ